MKFRQIDIPAAGTWSRDCEVKSLVYCKGFKISYHKDEDDTYWNLRSEIVIAVRVLSEEFSRGAYLIDLPTDGAFFEVLDSPWMAEFGNCNVEILRKCTHYVFRFYDETVEIIAKKIDFEKLNEKPKAISD